MKHLTDQEIQSFATDKAHCERGITGHIDDCAECKVRAQAYQQLIQGIRQQLQPAFDFDLSAAVLQHLPTQRRTAGDKLLTWVFIFVCSSLVGIVLYFFRGFLNTMFRGIAGISVYLMVTSAVAVIGVLFIEMQKRYKKEMRVLDLY